MKRRTASLLQGDQCLYPKAFHFSTEALPDEDSSSTALKATVEDDLDSALDDILGMAFEEAGNAPKSRIKVQAVATLDDYSDDEVR